MGVGHVLGSCQASRGLRAPGVLTHRQPRPSACGRGTQGRVAGSCSPLCCVEGQPCRLDASGKLSSCPLRCLSGSSRLGLLESLVTGRLERLLPATA